MRSLLLLKRKKKLILCRGRWEKENSFIKPNKKDKEDLPEVGVTVGFIV